ncbi:sensor histidine kinase [Caldicellulosiruptoraceae bacterium PP1]
MIDYSINQLSDSILKNINYIENLTNYVFFDLEVQKIFNLEFHNYDDIEMLNKMIINKINVILQISKMPMIIRIYVNNPNIPEVYFDEDKFPSYIRRTTYVEIYRMSSMNKILKNYYKNLSNSKLLVLPDDEKHERISFLKAFYNYNELSKVGFLRVIIDKDVIFEPIIKHKNTNIFFPITITTNDKKIIFSNVKDFKSINLINYHVFYKQINNNLSINYYVPIEVIKQDIYRIIFTLIMVTLLSLLISFIIAYLLISFILKRIKTIKNAIEEFSNGNLSKRININYNDEFKEIIETFNKMANEIQTLIEEVYQQKLEKKQIELELLQSQINPHFLYNSFSSLLRLHQLNEHEKLERFIHNMVSFYRLSLSKGEKITSLEKEIELITNYLEIYKIKYSEDKINYRIQLDKNILEIKIPKLTLQPIIENSIVHFAKKGKLNILLKSKIEKDIVYIDIIDNGNGISDEILEQILVSDFTSKSYGLYNVNKRLKLYYGENYGINIISKKGYFTKVTISIPICPLSNVS